MKKLANLCRLLSLTLVVVHFYSPALATSADSQLKDAEQAFVEKRFHAAEDLLNAAIAKNPTDQTAHLMLARTYVQLLDNKAAEHEYANCIKCNPFSSVGRLAHQETINIGGRSEADKARPSDDVKTVTKSVDIINREAGDLKGGYGVSSRMTPSYNQPVSPAASTIASPAANIGASTAASSAASRTAHLAELRAARAASHAARMNARVQPGVQAYVPGTTAGAVPLPRLHRAYGQSLPQGAIAQPGMSAYGQPSAAQISAQARMAAHRAERDARRAARMSRFNQSSAAAYSPTPNSAINTAQSASAAPSPAIPPTTSMPGRSGQPTYIRPSQQPGFAPSASYNASDSEVQRMHKQQENAQHAEYAQDSANNLQRLMSEKQNQNSPKLRALGTNLFVRYYGSHDQDGSTANAPGADPVLEMKAKQMKLGDTK